MDQKINSQPWRYKIKFDVSISRLLIPDQGPYRWNRRILFYIAKVVSRFFDTFTIRKYSYTIKGRENMKTRLLGKRQGL